MCRSRWLGDVSAWAPGTARRARRNDDGGRLPWLPALHHLVDRLAVVSTVCRDARDLALDLHEQVRYPAGIINPHHTHPCGHGMFVLEGTLVTHKGSFQPGTFVWFPEGEVMEHGASPEGDCTVLFITNKSFRIDYVS